MDSDSSGVFEDEGDRPTDLVSPTRGVREHSSMALAGYQFPRAPRNSNSRRRSSSSPKLKVESAVSCDSANDIMLFDRELDMSLDLVAAEGKYMEKGGRLTVPEPLSCTEKDLEKASQTVRQSPAMRRSPLHEASQKPVSRKRSLSLPNYSEQLAAMTLATIDHAELDLYDAVLAGEDGGDTGPFSCLQQVTKHPAHLACFLRFHFDDDDVEGNSLECLLFHVLAHVYRHQDVWGNWKEVRGFGQSIFDLFFAANASLALSIDEASISEMKTVLERKDTDADVLAVFDKVVETVVHPVLARNLDSYNSKRMMGFGSLYGENELRGVDTGAEAEKEAIRSILLPVLDHLSQGLSADRSEELMVCRNADMVKALLTFTVSSGVSMSAWIADSAKRFGKQRKRITPFRFAFRSGHERLPEREVRSHSPKPRLPRWAQNIIRQSSLERKSPTN